MRLYSFNRENKGYSAYEDPNGEFISYEYAEEHRLAAEADKHRIAELEAVRDKLVEQNENQSALILKLTAKLVES